MLRKKPTLGPFRPNPDTDNLLLWEWVHSLFYFYAVMIDRPLDSLSQGVLHSLAPSEFGPFLSVHGSPVFAALPIYQARSSDYVDGSSGWQVIVVGLESAARDASTLLFWIQGSGDEAQRFQNHLQNSGIPEATRALGGTPCIVLEGGVAEDTYELGDAWARRGRLPPIDRHRLGERLASWPMHSIAP